MAAAKRRPAVRWVKVWVPQPVVSTGGGGGKCSLLNWVREGTAKALDEQETEPEETKPEPTTEILFLCSFEGCGKTFTDAHALKKHSNTHGERQHVCHYVGCGKKFFDSSKLKRHFLIHTGERNYVCPYEGCGKAFSLDFNLRTHMRTHSQENYRVCPYPDCVKRFTQECKLKTHIKSHHEKSMGLDTVKHTPPAERQHHTLKASAVVYGSAQVERPYACPYEGCVKAYIHEYKLNLHWREHPSHNPEVSSKCTPATDHDMDEDSDQDAYVTKGRVSKKVKRSNPSFIRKMPPAKLENRKGSSVPPANINPVKKQWPGKEAYKEDSDETEEDAENAEGNQWQYQEVNENDEETEDED